MPCYWKMDQQTSPQLQPFLSCPSNGSDNFPFLPLAAKPSTLFPSSTEATSLSVAAHEWVKDEFDAYTAVPHLVPGSVSYQIDYSDSHPDIFTCLAELKNLHKVHYFF